MIEATQKSRQAGQYDKLARENEALRETLREIRSILLRPAGNMRLMQIAEPARRCINLIKPFLKDRESEANTP